MDSALRELALEKKSSSSNHLVNLLDVILANSVRKVQDAKYELLSPMQAGNSNATPEYLSSFLDLCSDTATNFAQSLNDLVVEGNDNLDDSVYAQVILSSSELTSALNDLMLNLKGLSRIITTDEGDTLVNHTTNVLSGAESFFLSLTSDSINELETEEDKIDFVIDCNVLFQHLLQASSSFIDTLRSSHKLGLTKKDNLEDVVENKFSQTADTVEKASLFLRNLMSQIGKGADVEVHESILSAALAITKAVSILIAAATDSQIEIVSRGKGENFKT